ncbi:glycosyltransferase family 2 protein [Bacillus sp. Marseille-P3661]|uniref:glycosyltransferase family 2 protein n=1 Tax=Bacillus sp. Marseille-P3661 TaxID=1936234 RepID=UPI000C829BFA|nr:glycosyltransferase family 2 protein [Bacillus sp. Marseille-P3661]
MGKSYEGISIVIPYYKGEKYIDCTLDKLLISLENCHINYEIIIVNDSPDENIDKYLDFSPYLKVITNDSNKGISYSRNVGKKISKFSYIYFIDQDDWVEKDFFKEAYKFIEKDYDIILFNYNITKDEYKKVYYNSLFNTYVNFISSKNLIKYGNVFRTPGQVIIKKDNLKDFIETNTMGADDYYLFIDLFHNRKQKKIKYIDKPLLNYRLHDNNYTNKTNFYNSSLECFNKYKYINNEIKKMEKYLIKRYSGDIYLTLVSRMIRKLITI